MSSDGVSTHCRGVGERGRDTVRRGGAVSHRCESEGCTIHLLYFYTWITNVHDRGIVVFM